MMRILPRLLRIVALSALLLSALLNFSSPRVVQAHSDAHSQELNPPQAAQTPIHLTSVTVQIWPEFDRSSALVIVDMTLAPDVKLPAALTVRIPAAAGEPHAVAYTDASSLITVPYQATTGSQWNQLTFTTPMPEARVEYYDPSLKITAQQRDFTFQWLGDYATDSLLFQVQQPIHATEMSFTPSMGSGQPGLYGLTYFSLVNSNQPAGMSFDLQIRYNKPDATLSDTVISQSVQPTEPITQQTPGRATMDVVPWIVGGLGIALILGGGLWYWRSGKAQPFPSSKNAAPNGMQRHRKSPTPSEETGAAYCQQCGKRVQSGDVFCRVCGTKLH